MSHFDVQGINKGSASRVEEHIRKDNKMKRSRDYSKSSVGLM
ncbi:hypothetical protein SAMN05444349_10453 [Bacteroides faecichinchillae]|uniref:Uncharacterized protein n=1 Tax=Bacteroides faecichinchillae TaxID=871325 RepID=A0A1M4V0K2_9BACE|nr:hypothetical protein SAMN05444349_10453 [Bacteroides faecichinchillae]